MLLTRYSTRWPPAMLEHVRYYCYEGVHFAPRDELVIPPPDSMFGRRFFYSTRYVLENTALTPTLARDLAFVGGSASRSR